MQLKTGRKAWKISKRRFSQTVRKQFATIANFAMCCNQFRIAKSNTPLHCSFAKFASHKTYAKFRIAKIRNEFANQIRNAKISQCQIRNANFPMPIRNAKCQFRNAKFNFAMPISISQCNTLFICLNLSEISQCEIHKPTLRISQTHSHCEIHCLCEIYICRPCHPL